MAPLPPAIAEEVALTAGDLLEQAGAVVSGGQADYIRSGQPQSTYGKIQQQIARQACRQYADDPAQFPGRAAVLVENACRPYLDDIGYGSPPRIELPFRGGQCCDATYAVSFSGLNTAQEPVSGTTNISGKILGSYERSNQPSQPTKTAGVRRELCSGQVDEIGLITVFESQDTGFEITGVVRIDGLPDDCGNVPPELEDPIPPPTPSPTVEPFQPEPGIDIDIGVEINPDGTINVNIGTGPIQIDPFGGGDGGGGDGGGATPTQNPKGGPENLGDPIEGGPGTGNDDGDVDFGAPPDGRVWVGVLLEVTGDGGAAKLPNSVAGAEVYPTVSGNLTLKYAGGQGPSLRVTSKWSEAFRPSNALEVVGVRVGMLPSFSYRVYPVSEVICPDDECSNSEGG